MADYAPNYSPRYIFKYSVLGQGHQFTWRLPRGADRGDAGIVTKLKAFLNAIKGYRYDSWNLVSGVYVPQDTFVGLPVDITPGTLDAGSISSSGIPASAKALETRFQMKGNAGGRGAFSLYSMQNPFGYSGIGADFRVTTAEDAIYAAGITALSELSPMLVPLGSTTSTWYQYVNFSYNKYWVKQVRA